MKEKMTPEIFATLSTSEKIKYLDDIKHTVAVYAVKDTKADEFGQLIQNEKGEGAMCREFNDAIKSDKSGVMKDHPDDFELWKVGNFNKKTGEYNEDLVLLATGTTLPASEKLKKD